jgi:Flp pilus assembly pilin Flp
MNDILTHGARRAVVEGPWLLRTAADRLAAAAADGAARTPARADLRDERGAQAAEYAMLGGVSAAACGALVTILSRTDIIEEVVTAVVDSLVDVVGSWF